MTNQLRGEEEKTCRVEGGENRWLRLLRDIALFGDAIASPPPPRTLQPFSALFLSAAKKMRAITPLCFTPKEKWKVL